MEQDYRLKPQISTQVGYNNCQIKRERKQEEEWIRTANNAPRWTHAPVDGENEMNKGGRGSIHQLSLAGQMTSSLLLVDKCHNHEFV